MWTLDSIQKDKLNWFRTNNTKLNYESSINFSDRNIKNCPSAFDSKASLCIRCEIKSKEKREKEKTQVKWEIK